MEIASPEFFLFAGLLALVYHVNASPRWRLWTLAVGNVLFLATWLTDGRRIALAAWLLGSGYAMTWLVQKRVIVRAWPVALYVLSWIYLFFVVKQPAPGATGTPGAALVASSFMTLVGFSYLMFKQIHVLVDAFQGQLRRVTPLVWFDYTAGFLTWVSGPIQRYEDFAEQVEAESPPPGTEDVLRGLERIVDGCLRALVLAAWVWKATDLGALLAAPQDGFTGLRFAGFFLASYAFIYLNFSGYCDIVIGVGMLLGLRLPENFDRPWMARNVLEFWQRWHLTLSHWLRDYVFNPLYKHLLEMAPRAALLSACVAYFFTFDLAGLWHGPTVNFILFGLLHGLGTSFNQLGNAALSRMLGRESLQAYRSSRLVRFLATIACQAYIAITMLVFAYPPEQLRELWRHLRHLIAG